MTARLMPIALWIGLLFYAVSATAIDYNELTISRDQWPQHANSMSIAALPQVRQVIEQFDESGRYRLVVRYPGGESGAKWAEQLVHCLVAYGVPGEFLGRELGSGDPDLLLLLMIKS